MSYSQAVEVPLGQGKFSDVESVVGERLTVILHTGPALVGVHTFLKGQDTHGPSGMSLLLEIVHFSGSS